MEHTEASETMAAERYLLDELTLDERHAFEDHFFSCTECAASVRDGSKLIATIKHDKSAVRKRPIITWLAMAASFSLVAVLTYQNAVTIPKLRRDQSIDAGPRILRSYSLLTAGTRGDGDEVVIENGREPFSLYFDVPPDPGARGFVVEIVDGAGRVRVNRSITPEQSRETVQLLVPGGSLPPGRYSLRVHSEAAASAGQGWSFVVR